MSLTGSAEFTRRNVADHAKALVGWCVGVVAYVTLIDGHANDRWGTRGMLLTEAMCGVAGILVFVVLARATRRRGGPSAAARPSGLQA